jgi:hypothetical protein
MVSDVWVRYKLGIEKCEVSKKNIQMQGSLIVTYHEHLIYTPQPEQLPLFLSEVFWSSV